MSRRIAFLFSGQGSQYYQMGRGLYEHNAVFRASMDRMDRAAQALLGEPVAHPTVPVAEGSRYLLELDSKEGYAASSWHTDVTFVDAYPKASILRALTIPEAGGDTLWANGETAYEGLPESLRQLVNGLRAVHTNLYDYAAVLQGNTTRDKDVSKVSLTLETPAVEAKACGAA